MIYHEQYSTHCFLIYHLYSTGWVQSSSKDLRPKSFPIKQKGVTHTKRCFNMISLVTMPSAIRKMLEEWEKNPFGIPSTIRIDADTLEMNREDLDVAAFLRLSSPKYAVNNYKRILCSCFYNWEAFAATGQDKLLVTEGAIRSKWISFDCPRYQWQSEGNNDADHIVIGWILTHIRMSEEKVRESVIPYFNRLLHKQMCNDATCDKLKQDAFLKTPRVVSQAEHCSAVTHANQAVGSSSSLASCIEAGPSTHPDALVVKRTCDESTEPNDHHKCPASEPV